MAYRGNRLQIASPVNLITTNVLTISQKLNPSIYEPFEYKGKTFAGFATPDGDAQSSDNNVEDQNILELTLFEVPKDTKIIKDKKNDADHIIDYQNTNDGKQEKESKRPFIRKFININ